MSGHSKFANIKHKKEKNDAAKGKIVTKIGREIAVDQRRRRSGSCEQQQTPRCDCEGKSKQHAKRQY